MNKPEIIEKLKKMGVECDPSMTKAELEALLADPENKSVSDLAEEPTKEDSPPVVTEPPVITQVFDGYNAPAGVPLNQYNPATHYAVNKKKFDEMVVCMVSQRTKAYLKMSMATRLAELLELGENGDNKARELIGAMFARVANGE